MGPGNRVILYSLIPKNATTRNSSNIKDNKTIESKAQLRDIQSNQLK